MEANLQLGSRTRRRYVYTQAALTSVQCRCSQRKMCQIDRRTVVCYDLDETTCKLDETQTQITRLIMLRLRSIDHALRQSSLSRFSWKSRKLSSFLVVLFWCKIFFAGRSQFFRSSSKISRRNRSRLIFDTVNRGTLIFEFEKNI